MKGGNIRQNFYFHVELEVDNLLVCTEILTLLYDILPNI
jgi:hypothetical protein